MDLPEGLIELNPHDAYLPTSAEVLMLENAKRVAPFNLEPPHWALRMVEELGRQYRLSMLANSAKDA